MTEKLRIISLYEALYAGDPWIEVNISKTLSGLTYRQAAEKIRPDVNSVWEIVNHVVDWRKNVLKRVQGRVMKTPDDNYFRPVTVKTETAWKKTLRDLESSQREWLRYLSSLTVPDLKKPYPSNGMSYYDHIMGILQHDAYHLGQIRLLLKLAR